MTDLILKIETSGRRREVELTERLTIGRGAEADVQIQDSNLSRIHAVVYWERDQVWVRDHQSTNGTWLNGLPVPSTGIPFQAQDIVTLGHQTRLLLGPASGGNTNTNPMTSGYQPSSSDSPPGPHVHPTANPAAPSPVPLIASLVFVLVLLIGMSALTIYLFQAKRRTEVDRNRIEADKRELTQAKAQAEEKQKQEQQLRSQAEKQAEQSRLEAVKALAEAEKNAPAPARRLYRELSEAERIQYIEEHAQQIGQMMGNQPYAFPPDSVLLIKGYLDGFAKRVGNGATRGWGEDLRTMMVRAQKCAPFIIKAFNKENVPPVVGLYIPVIESGYRLCLTSPAGAKGMFQFMPATARGYGLQNLNDMCNPRAMAPLAARYIKDRMQEFGKDPMSVALCIAAYNRATTSVVRDLHRSMSRENPERAFWTLVANKVNLDHWFQNENIKYVPQFFAAAIVGENPWDFGLDMQKLSSYTIESQSDETFDQTEETGAIDLQKNVQSIVFRQEDLIVHPIRQTSRLSF